MSGKGVNLLSMLPDSRETSPFVIPNGVPDGAGGDIPELGDVWRARG
jgi:hypothetical protein